MTWGITSVVGAQVPLTTFLDKDAFMARKMSDEHKAALAKGRAQGRAVRDYLAALEQDRKPGRRMDADTVKARIDELQTKVDAEPNPAKRVELIQRRLDLEERLVTMADDVDLEELEKGFVDAAAEYSDRKGITYTAWREAGVPAGVLKEAGIRRTRRASV